jgi:hypothetical protein
MTIPTFWASAWLSLRLFARRSPSCRSAGLSQGNQTVRFEISDGSIFMTPDVGPTFLVLGHEDIKGVLWEFLRLAPLILPPLAIFWAFWCDNPRWPFFPYDNLFALGWLGQIWLNQDLFPIDLDFVHVHQEWVFVELHLGLSTNFNHPSFMADWTSRWKTL